MENRFPFLALTLSLRKSGNSQTTSPGSVFLAARVFYLPSSPWQKTIILGQTPLDPFSMGSGPCFISPLGLTPNCEMGPEASDPLLPRAARDLWYEGRETLIRLPYW